MSGLYKWDFRNYGLSFLTLTSGKKTKKLYRITGLTNLSRHFILLKQRCERIKHCKIEYFKVETSEGCGVLHIIWNCPFIPQFCLMSMWLEIHGAFKVDIRFIYSSGICGYILSHYIAGQSFIRMSSSKYWIYPHWRDDLRSEFEKDVSKKEKLRLWHNVLRQYNELIR